MARIWGNLKERVSHVRWWLAFAAGIIVCTIVFAVRNGLVTNSAQVRTVQLEGPLTLAALSSNAKILAAVDTSDKMSGKYSIHFWDVTNNQLISTTQATNIYKLAFSPDGKNVAASGNDGVRFFRVSDGKTIQKLDGSQLFCLAFSPSGEMFAAGGEEGEILVWRLADSRLLYRYDTAKWITSIAFSSDGKTIAAGNAAMTGFVQRSELPTDDNPIVLWQFTESVPVSILNGHQYGVLALAFSPQGKTLASGGSDGLLKLWSADGKVLLKTIRVDDLFSENIYGDKTPIDNMAFSSDGKFIAVESDNNILIIQVSDGRLRSTLRGHTDSVLQVTFARDSMTLWSVGKDNTIREWTPLNR